MEPNGPYTYSHEKQHFKNGLYPTIIGLIAIILPFPLTKAIAFIILPISLWIFIYHGSTLISIKLNGSHRSMFQIAISIVFPLLLSTHFIILSPPASIEAALTTHLNKWFIIVTLLAGVAGFHFAGMANKEHPFRIFIVASLVLFVITYTGFHDIHLSDDSAQHETLKMVAIEKQKIFAQYLIYVFSFYMGALIKFRKERQASNKNR